MTSDLQNARDDLAYMRALVSGGAAMHATIGEAFFWAGTLYGAQCLLHVVQELGLLPWDGPIGLAIVAAPTVLFCAVLAWIIVKDRNKTTGGPASRALASVFQGAGLANLVMVFVFAYGSNKFETPWLWLYQPVVVCMFQGVAWYVAWTIVRRAWFAIVALGWFAATIALGTVVGDAGPYLLILSLTLIFCMAVPGWLIWRGAKKAG